MADFDRDVRLQLLIERWRNAFPKASGTWIDGLLDQLARAAQSQFPGFRWSAMPAVDDGHLHAPVVTRARRVPSLGAMQFDVYFYPFNLLDATPVESRMVRRSDMFSKVIAAGGESEVRVLQLAGELRARGYSRIPFVNPDDRFVYIAHLSMLDQFLVEQLATDKAADVGRLTLADLFSRQPKRARYVHRHRGFCG